MREADIDHRIVVERLERRHVEIGHVEREVAQQIADTRHFPALRRRREAVKVEDGLRPAAAHPPEWYPGAEERPRRQWGCRSPRPCARPPAPRRWRDSEA